MSAPVPRDAPDSAAVIAVAVVGVVGVAGLVASAASLVSGGFEDADHRWAAIVGALLGAVALLATWDLLRRLQHSGREDLELPLEVEMFMADLRGTRGPLSRRCRRKARRLYGRLVSDGLAELADELRVVTIEAQMKSEPPR